MNRPFLSLRYLAFLTLSVSLISLGSTGCSKKNVQEEEPTIPSAANADESSATGDSDNGKAMGLETINFPYDVATLDASATEKLKQNADILKDKKSVKIQIEGHCDQRGGIQYNLALGERRANAVRKYLIGLGVSKDRITTISFGKERPLDNGTSEEAYAKNRRANFVVTSR